MTNTGARQKFLQSGLGRVIHPQSHRFREWLGKQQEGRRKRLDEAPLPGMRPDRSIELLSLGQPKPQPRILDLVYEGRVELTSR